MWQVIGASTQGTSHIRFGSPCQDAHGYQVLENCVIAAVADGLGSAAKSDEGAKLAIGKTLDELVQALAGNQPDNTENWIQALSNAFAQARQSLEQTAETSGLPLREYGTTLIAVVVTPNWLAVGHIGDGAVVALIEDDTLETVSAPQRGEYANEVTPLTAQNALDFVRFSARPISVKAVALLSDGLQNLSINAATRTPYAPFFTPFFDAIGQVIDIDETSKQLADFLDSERICSKTDDDKTLVVVGKVQPEREKLYSDAKVE